MGKDSGYYKEIIGKLENLTKREFSFFALIGIQKAILTGIIVFTIFSLFEMVFYFSSTVRTVLFFIFVVCFLSAFIFLFVIPLLKYFNIFGKINYYRLADKVGINFPSIKDDLLNAMQLVSIDNKKTLYSEKLIDEAFKQVYNKTRSIKFESIIDFKKAKQMFLYFIGIIIFCAALFLFIPNLQAASNRLLSFDKEFIPPAKFIFEVQPGDAAVTKGDNVLISIKVKGEVPKEIFLAVKDINQTDFEFKKIISDSLNNYNFKINAVRNSFKYFAAAEDIESEIYSIDVIDPPIIKNLDVTINSPKYSKIPQVNQKDNGNVAGLTGSAVEIKLSSTKNLKHAFLKFNDSSKVDFKVDQNQAEGNFKIKKDNNYQIFLIDTNGNKNLSPITYSVKALNDAYPSIELISPAQSVNLSNDNRLPLYLKIADDYGFNKLLINYRLSESKYENPQSDFSSVEIPFNKNQIEAEINHVWNLSQLRLAAEDVLTFYLEIFDNDYVSGPKSAKSQTLTIRVPSLNEILSRAEETQTNAEQDLKETLKRADELKKNLEKIDQDLKQDKKEISWEEKQKIEKSLNEFQKIQEKVESTKKELSKMQQELQQNNLLSKETLEKYMELQKLMQEFSTEEMKEAMEQMQKMLQNLDRKQIQDAMENFKLNEEAFKKSIERTMNLLKRMQVEQKVDELLKRAENLTKNQDEINKETKKNDLSDQQERDRLSSRQNKISDELEKLDNEMEKLSEKMNELSDMPKEEMEKLKEEFKKQQNQKKSEQASEKIQENKKGEAQQMQKQLSQNMKQLNENLNQMQQSMAQKNQIQTFKDMMKIVENLVALSKQQENLKDDVNNSDPLSTSFKEKAEKQNNLERNLDKILQQMLKLSQKTFAVSPEMGKALGDAKREMNRSLQSIQNRNGKAAAINQENSMKSLNEAAAMMKGAMEAMMNGGSGQGGMMSLMQQLHQMGQQQMNLNNLTQMLQQGQKGGLSPQQQAQLQRLAQQQELIKKSLEQLNKEAKMSGQASKIPADLQNVVKQMHEVISGMNTDKLDDKLVQKQERILSKLLDAQKSINERDFEKNRESKSGENIVRESPADLNLSSEKNKNKIKDELIKAVQEGYSRDYEELIKKYYEALQKENAAD